MIQHRDCKGQCVYNLNSNNCLQIVDECWGILKNVVTCKSIHVNTRYRGQSFLRTTTGPPRAFREPPQ